MVDVSLLVLPRSERSWQMISPTRTADQGGALKLCSCLGLQIEPFTDTYLKISSEVRSYPRIKLGFTLRNFGGVLLAQSAIITVFSAPCLYVLYVWGNANAKR